MSNAQKTFKIILRKPANSISCTQSTSGIDERYQTSQILENKPNQLTNELKESPVLDHRVASPSSTSDKASKVVEGCPKPLTIPEWSKIPRRIRSVRRARELNPVEEGELPYKKRKIMRRSSKSYSCNQCDRSFTSHEALGGHKAWHVKKGNKIKPVRDRYASVVVREKWYKCEPCSREFENAQALGGHKRHCKRRAIAFDLNEYPSDWSF